MIKVIIMTAILADIGGTNTRVALADGTHVRPNSIAKFANAEYCQPGTHPDPLSGRGGHRLGRGGLCRRRRPRATRRGRDDQPVWIIDHAQLTRATGATKVAILNDLQAQGQALGHIAPENLRPIMPGHAVPNASMLVVGLGTGVNAAPVHNTPWGRVVPPSECGHVSMPIRN